MTASIPAPSTSRPSFALTGRSSILDPLTEAVRGDLADVRLADRVFAPHYARAVEKKLIRAATLRADRAAAAPAIAELAAGDIFELLDITGGVAWGIAIDAARVGYVEADALGPVG